MKLFASLALVAACITPAFAQDKAPSIDMMTASHQLISQHKDLHWVSVEDIAKSLPKHAITVGLDVDDTMLFSSPVFYYGKQKYSPNSYDYLKNQDFWNEASTGLDKFSVPKKSAVKLVTMHLKRGDTVYFVTGRTRPNNKAETVTALIRNIFPEQYRAQIQPVIFSHGLDKVKQLKAAKINIFYGDADDDISSAHKAGIEGIRFLRNAQSTYTPMPQAGKFGEKILAGSNY